MRYYAVTEDPNELMHFGIKGMKWGIRRTDAQLGHPRHTGSRKPRSIAYKKAQAKLSASMKNGIKKVETKWKTYNSPQAKEARFMKKAMQQARNGTLKYGKLTDKQVQQVADRLYLERNARSLGSTENPRFGKRLKMAIGTGIVEGVGRGASAYIEERFRGRGRTTADIKRDKRMAKYEGRDDVIRKKAKKQIDEEYYKTAYEEGNAPNDYKSTSRRAKYLADVKKRNKESDYRANIQKIYDENEARLRANNNARFEDEDRRSIRKNASENKLGSGKALARLNAYNESREDIDKYGNAYLDSYNTALDVKKRQEARSSGRSYATSPERQFATNQIMQEYAKTQRQRAQEAAVRENATRQKELARKARQEEIRSSRSETSRSTNYVTEKDYGARGSSSSSPWVGVRPEVHSPREEWRRQNDWQNTSNRRKRKGKN